MNQFIKNSLLVACIVLVIALTIVAIFIAMDDTKIKFPPRVDECPDYWIQSKYLTGYEDEEGCVNTKNLGTCQEQIKNFNVPPYDNPGNRGPDTGNCEKSKWAKNCNLTWDGITNKDNICTSKRKKNKDNK